AGTKVSGILLGAASGKAPATDRVYLCCFKSGPFERLSAPLQPDGTFEFTQVPEGHYNVELQSTPASTIVGSGVDGGEREVQNLKLLSSATVSAVSILVMGDFSVIPKPSRITVTWTAVNSGIPVTTYGTTEGTAWTLPSGVQFELTVSDIPSELKLKSIN